MNRRTKDDKPWTRAGHCCGCGKDCAVLYRVLDLYRYRCAECYAKELGLRSPVQEKP